jgi:PhzF family phenazine biosynthesis protein
MLTAKKKEGLIELDFPLIPVTDINAPEGLLSALAVHPKYIGKNSLNYLLVEVESETIVRNLQPDFELLAKLAVFGVIVTSRSDDPDYDFVSRFFAPGAGIKEDPVTGSAHCTLGPYWGERLHKKEMMAYQASARGGEIHIRLDDDRVRLGGKAVTVLRGALLDPK